MPEEVVVLFGEEVVVEAGLVGDMAGRYQLERRIWEGDNSDIVMR